MARLNFDDTPGCLRTKCSKHSRTLDLAPAAIPTFAEPSLRGIIHPKNPGANRCPKYTSTKSSSMSLRFAKFVCAEFTRRVRPALVRPAYLEIDALDPLASMITLHLVCRSFPLWTVLSLTCPSSVRLNPRTRELSRMFAPFFSAKEARYWSNARRLRTQVTGFERWRVSGCPLGECKTAPSISFSIMRRGIWGLNRLKAMIPTWPEQ